MTDPPPRAASPAASQKARGRGQFADCAEVACNTTRNRSLPAEQWRALFAASGLVTEEERILAKTCPFALGLSHAQFHNALPAARGTFAITIGQDGEIISCGSRAVLLQGRMAA